MGAPVIFKGKWAKLLNAAGVLKKSGAIIEHSGTRNYIANGHAEIDTTGWATYNDGASQFPTDATGGVADITLTRSTSSPLSGDASFLITKDAADRQGQGVSYDFTIDAADKNKYLSLSFDFEASANYVAGSSPDLLVGIYDVTNGFVIPPANYAISFPNGTFQTTFAATSSTSYRLIFHITTTNANAWTFKFDSVLVGPQQIVYGPAASDWQTFSMTIAATSSNPTKGTVSIDEAKWRRVGDSMEIQYTYRQSAAGSAGSGIYRFVLPSGYQIDTSKITPDNDTTDFSSEAKAIVGPALVHASGTSGWAYAYVFDSTSLCLKTNLRNDNGSARPLHSSNNYTLANSEFGVSFRAVVPILGWSTNVVSANSSTFRISSILQNGTRVTSAPTRLGEYRSRSKTTVTSNTFADVAPTTAISGSNGLRLHAANYSAAQTSGEISLYDIYIGDRYFRPEVYSSTGFTGQVFHDFAIESSTVANGTRFSYDKATGILTIESGLNISSNTSRGIGINTSGSQVSSGYVDVVLSDNALAVQQEPIKSTIHVTGGSGFGSTATMIRRFSTIVESTGGAITFSQSATNGDSFSIHENGTYVISYSDTNSASSGRLGISKNSSQLTTAIQSINNSDRIISADSGSGLTGHVSAPVRLNSGDVIRAHTNSSFDGTTDSDVAFIITKVGN